MLGRLRIAGFKRFDAEGVELPLAPVTLLLGGNSTGKSSVFQALLCLGQSWQRPSGIVDLTTAGTWIDLGRFGRVLHRQSDQSVDKVVVEANEVVFSWEDADPGDTVWRLDLCQELRELGGDVRMAWKVKRSDGRFHDRFLGFMRAGSGRTDVVHAVTLGCGVQSFVEGDTPRPTCVARIPANAFRRALAVIEEFAFDACLEPVPGGIEV